MKPLISLFVAGLMVLPSLVHAADAAQAKLWCLSLRFQSGTDLNAEYSLDFTMLSIGINGELAPDFGGSYSHFSYPTSRIQVVIQESFRRNSFVFKGANLEKRRKWPVVPT